MSRPDGYEELPEGEEPLLQHQGSGPGPAAAQGLAGTGYGDHAPGQPALGVPAFPQQQPPAAGPRLEQLPPFPQYLADLPTAAEEWDRCAVIFAVWLGCSAATFAVALLTVNPLAISGAACATVAAATQRFPSWRANLSLGAAVKRIHHLAIAALCLLGIVATMCTLIAIGLSAACGSDADAPACAEVAEVTTLFAAWYSFYTALTAVIVRRASKLRRLLNPVSTGVVTL